MIARFSFDLNAHCWHSFHFSYQFEVPEVQRWFEAFPSVFWWHRRCLNVDIEPIKNWFFEEWRQVLANHFDQMIIGGRLSSNSPPSRSSNIPLQDMFYHLQRSFLLFCMIERHFWAFTWQIAAIYLCCHPTESEPNNRQFISATSYLNHEMFRGLKTIINGTWGLRQSSDSHVHFPLAESMG